MGVFDFLLKDDLNPSKCDVYELALKLNDTTAIFKQTAGSIPFEDCCYNLVFKGKRSSCVYPTLDEAILHYLEMKHLGSNSQFVEFASRMLNIRGK